MLKANRILKHYEKASNCTATVMNPELGLEKNNYDSVCSRCKGKNTKNTEKKCACLHEEALNKARMLGGSFIYLCHKGYVFWTSPFYSGERFAGALLAGGIKGSEKNNEKIKALAQIMLLCADKISSMSFTQKNVSMQKQAYSIDYQMMNEDKLMRSFPAKKQNNESHICTLEMERMLMASLRRGDKEEGQKILVKLLNNHYLEIKNSFLPVQWTVAFRLRALELAVLLSRAAADPRDIKENAFLEATNRLFKRIDECSSIEEITEVLRMIIERTSRMIFSFHGVRHFSALRKAERYIWENYSRKLSLKEIAAASGLSAPYFSTIFKEEMKENLSNYLNRLRVEKAAAMLVNTNLPISEIAIDCGFEDQSWFSKIFRNNTGLTPGKYRECGIVAEGNSSV